MKYGAFVPLFGELAEPSHAVDIARAAEKAGWDGLFVSDLVETGEGETVADACITVAAISSTTTSLRLGLVTPVVDRRRPWVLARQSAIIDHLSGGRLTFGTGVGYASWHENLGNADRAQNEKDDARASLFEESLAVLLLCWSGNPVRHEGKWMQVDSGPFLPTPLQRPRVPVWLSVEWPQHGPLRRAAHLDGILPVFAEQHDMKVPPDPKQVQAMREMLHGMGAPPHQDVALRGVLGPFWTAESRDRLTELEKAGATWWLETARPGEPYATVLERIVAGPPVA